MKLKQLEGLLGNLDQFSSPKIELEQYPAGPHIASRMLYTAENSFGDISNKVVADFGCGCGTLGLAAALLGADHVIGFDIDSEALEIASSNAEDVEGNGHGRKGFGLEGKLEMKSFGYILGKSTKPNPTNPWESCLGQDVRQSNVDINFVQCDIRNLECKGKLIDTVVMNPPFGTRSKGADMMFLSAALKNASQAVYSLHKTTTREHVKRAALRDYNARSAEVLCELRYDLPQMYKFHKKKEVDIAVDLWRFEPGNGV